MQPHRRGTRWRLKKDSSFSHRRLNSGYQSYQRLTSSARSAALTTHTTPYTHRNCQERQWKDTPWRSRQNPRADARAVPAAFTPIVAPDHTGTVSAAVYAAVSTAGAGPPAPEPQPTLTQPSRESEGSDDPLRSRILLSASTRARVMNTPTAVAPGHTMPSSSSRA